MPDVPMVTLSKLPPVFQLTETPVTDADSLRLAGTGSHALAICPGLSLTFSSFRPSDAMDFRVESSATPVSFCCYLSGTRQHRYNLADGRSLECVTEAGTCTICRMQDLHGGFSVKPGECQTAIGIQVTPQFLSRWLPSETLKHHPDILPLLCSGNPSSVFHKQPTPPEIRTVLHQISTCTFRENIRRLYLEAKALELLSLHLASLTKEQKTRRTDPRIHDRITKAARILEREMTNPPTIARLSRRAGLNECHLKAGFRQVFGTTVFGYLQYHRMQEARNLMEHHGRNVSEAAWDVGYTNVSHFIAAFRKTFGITPGELLRSRD
ncbi:AraC family transcriptional regulator [Desulfobotulus sp. H1]|uniref:AraC family transcriptional regulator n=1 Tax=Desulfobotulus pelophilus TaxID=2823377 RepID=A0ABT3N7P4_9BACT|nr:AraC family transcriptional regulator [Desulfobotulus pelophilus]MCW7753472.1 AraC family transcriptional regulator [Desulfobotulus pelophilus]